VVQILGYPNFGRHLCSTWGSVLVMLALDSARRLAPVFVLLTLAVAVRIICVGAMLYRGFIGGNVAGSTMPSTSAMSEGFAERLNRPHIGGHRLTPISL
jgi:hypothetical protein